MARSSATRGVSATRSTRISGRYGTRTSMAQRLAGPPLGPSSSKKRTVAEMGCTRSVSSAAPTSFAARARSSRSLVRPWISMVMVYVNSRTDIRRGHVEKPRCQRVGPRIPRAFDRTRTRRGGGAGTALSHRRLTTADGLQSLHDTDGPEDRQGHHEPIPSGQRLRTEKALERRHRDGEPLKPDERHERHPHERIRGQAPPAETLRAAAHRLKRMDEQWP